MVTKRKQHSSPRPVKQGLDARAPLPEAEPQLLASNEQLALADLQIADSPVLPPDPALAVPPADVIPFGGVKPPFEPVEEIPSLGEGSSSTTLVILSQNPAPLTPSFLLEMGLQLGTLTDLKQGASRGTDGHGRSGLGAHGHLAV